MLKRCAARLPHRWQSELKRMHFGRQIARNEFTTSETKFSMLADFVHQGDWVVDIGANVGQYTKRPSDLGGPSGREFAFEPVPATFALLAANAERFANANVSLFNAAVSVSLDVMGMAIPRFPTGLVNHYEAHLTHSPSSGVQVLTVPLDALGIEHPVVLVKIDAEGHEAHVLAGMWALIERFKPVLIVETGSAGLIDDLKTHGYRADRASGSSNVVFQSL